MDVARGHAKTRPDCGSSISQIPKVLTLKVHFSQKKKQFRIDIISIAKQTNHHKALLGPKILNKDKVPQNLGQFFEFIQSYVDIGNLLQPFTFLCSEESNLNVEWFVHTELLDCDNHPPHVVCCYFIY